MSIVNEKFLIRETYRGFSGKKELFVVENVLTEDRGLLTASGRIFARDGKTVVFRRVKTGELLRVRLSVTQRLMLEKNDGEDI